jgi:xanthine dehydrogenase accessory factor
LVTYDTSDDDDLQFGVQLGCNGIVHILFEPIDDTKEYHPIRLLRELIAKRRDAVLCTLFSLGRSAEQQGTSLLYAEGQVHSGLSDQWLSGVMADVKEAFRSNASAFKEFRHADKSFKGFIEFMPPPPAIVIAGAGNDVLPLVDMLAILGWHTTVVDGRPHYATERRFRKADRVLVARPDQVLERLTTDPQTLFVLMTHNYNYDLTLLKDLLMKGFNYIGILGPRKKLDRMLTELQENGLFLNAEQLAAIHSPVGLDIGAETAEEIAVSVVAEMKAVLSRRSGGLLKEKQDPIHDRPASLSSHG